MLDVHSTEPSFNSDSSREARRERQVRDVALIPPPPSRLVLVPLAFTGGIVALAASPAVRSNRHVLIALLGAAFALCAWNVLLLVLARRRGRTLTLEVVPRTQHYIQACAQGSVLLYWGWFWRPVYESIPLIAAQLLFAYAFDMLLAWSRRDTYTLGFSPFPVVFSINLFLWFKPDWFFLQFAIIALGFAAKEFLRWTRDGRRVHIFNPSSFPLAIASLALLITGMSDITWGQSIAITQFYPPHMYLMLFVIGLPGQFLFGVTTMTMSAVVTTYLIGLIYFAASGIYFFYDSYIPIAVFLGMHLLFTDPSTSPRGVVGRLLFGALYGLSTVVLYELLGRAGLPTFYDKLLQVPLLNLSVKWIDHVTRSTEGSRLIAALSRLTPRRRHLAYMGVWTSVFVAMSALGGVGDDHPGQWLPFWQRACSEGRPYACPYLADLELNYCNQGSGWACNEAGIAHLALSSSGEDVRRLDAAQAAVPFQHGCELGNVVACENVRRMSSGRRLASAAPTLDDYPIILRGSKGPVNNRAGPALYALACAQGWPDTCERATTAGR